MSRFSRWFKNIFTISKIYVAIDYGYNGRTCYIIAKHHKDGKIEVLESGILSKDKVERAKKIKELFDMETHIYFP